MKRTKSEQAELLNKPAEDVIESSPAAKAVVSDEFTTMSDAEASEVTMMLRELIRGQKLLEHEMVAVRERMNAYDEAAARFNQDQERFIQEVLDKAEKLKATGYEKDKVIANGAKQFEHEIALAKADQVNARLRFEEDLRTMPKETLTVAGVYEIVSKNGMPTPTLFPEIIRIRHKQWVIHPNTPVEVPKIVADRYRQILADRRQNEELKHALEAQKQDTELAKEIEKINSKYNSNMDAFRPGSTA